MAEQSPAKVRYTGASLAYQGASVLGAGFTPPPMIAAGLVILGGGAPYLRRLHSGQHHRCTLHEGIQRSGSHLSLSTKTSGNRYWVSGRLCA